MIGLEAPRTAGRRPGIPTIEPGRVRRLLGAAILLLASLPVYRLLLGRETGLVGEATVANADASFSLYWTGILLAAVPAIIAARFARPAALEARLERAARLITAPRAVRFALLIAAVSAAATLLFVVFALHGKPNLIDAMSQLVHARYLAAGRLAGPNGEDAEFWFIQNTVLTPNGWVSQYPPGHVAILALGLRLGAVWAVGPLMVGLTVLFTALAAERLLPRDPVAARVGALALALSPFLIGLAGAYMNHVTAAAFAAMAVYFGLRARDGHWLWGLAAGAAVGGVLATRPLAAVVVAAVVAAILLAAGEARSAVPWAERLRRLAAAGAGGLPLLGLLVAYNRHFFGGAFRFGYDVALGPAIRLGFHRDPWGNAYGPAEALAYTSSDLLALGVNLIEGPLPITMLVGLFLLTARRLSTGQRIIAAWALLPVAANVFYWHHGIFMGPRMLNEAAPAWALLAAVAAFSLVRALPADRLALGGRISLRAGLAAAFVLSWLAGALYLGPERLLNYGRDFEAASPLIDAPRTDGPALVFVHGGWKGRLAMRLAAHGMRLDSVETAARQNSTCELARFTDAYIAHRLGAADAPIPALDFDPRPRVAGLRPVEIAPGDWIAARDGEVIAPACMREVKADRNGILDIAPLLWQADLPGLPPAGPLFVRDLGPELNRRMVDRFPERRPLVLLTRAPDAEPELVPYDAGMAMIWGGR